MGSEARMVKPMKKEKSTVSHGDNLELLLIRVGHWLWKQRKELGEVWEEACQSVWTAKAEYRKPKQASRDERRMATSARISARTASKRASRGIGGG